MHYYSYEAFEADIRTLLPACCDFAPDTIVALSRGGMMGAQLLAYGLGIRRIGLLRVASYDGKTWRDSVTIEGDAAAEGSRRILVVDDIVDSGKTLREVKAYLHAKYPEAQLRCAAPWHKSSACEQPDFSCREATEWIEFFWDRFDA